MTKKASELTPEQVRAIRQLGSSGRVQYADIARKYNTTKAVVSGIVRRRVRKDVTS
jgi:hypothetical protein